MGRMLSSPRNLGRREGQAHGMNETKDAGKQPGAWPKWWHRSYPESPALASEPW